MLQQFPFHCHLPLARMEHYGQCADTSADTPLLPPFSGAFVAMILLEVKFFNSFSFNVTVLFSATTSVRWFAAPLDFVIPPTGIFISPLTLKLSGPGESTSLSSLHGSIFPPLQLRYLLSLETSSPRLFN